MHMPDNISLRLGTLTRTSTNSQAHDEMLPGMRDKNIVPAREMICEI